MNLNINMNAGIGINGGAQFGQGIGGPRRPGGGRRQMMMQMMQMMQQMMQMMSGQGGQGGCGQCGGGGGCGFGPMQGCQQRFGGFGF